MNINKYNKKGGDNTGSKLGKDVIYPHFNTLHFFVINKRKKRKKLLIGLKKHFAWIGKKKAYFIVLEIKTIWKGENVLNPSNPVKKNKSIHIHNSIMVCVYFIYLICHAVDGRIYNKFWMFVFLMLNFNAWNKY